jgi:Arc/MetJ family transcription regulator
MGAPLGSSYILVVRKTTLEIDDAVLEEARRILGTRGIKDTVDAALRQVRVQDARRRLVEQLRALDGLDLDDPEVMDSAWR